MATQDAAKRAYRFFREHAFSKEPFTYADLAGATGWSVDTAKDYVGKLWRDVIQRQKGKDQLLVRPEFKRLSEDRFLAVASQKRKLFADYKRFKYNEVMQYEFLLPLTHETQLRKALDDLFYEDAIHQRLTEVNLDQLGKLIERQRDESEKDYIRRLCTVVSNKFAGYSISHISGRYLADKLRSRADAAKMIEMEQRYLIDETTAAVRFIVPLETSRQVISGDFEEVTLLSDQLSQDTTAEQDLVRTLFMTVFAEAVVRTVEGEDAIWLLEETSSGRKLYVWRREE